MTKPTYYAVTGEFRVNCSSTTPHTFTRKTTKGVVELLTKLVKEQYTTEGDKSQRVYVLDMTPSLPVWGMSQR